MESKRRGIHRNRSVSNCERQAHVWSASTLSIYCCVTDFDCSANSESFSSAPSLSLSVSHIRFAQCVYMWTREWMWMRREKKHRMYEQHPHAYTLAQTHIYNVLGRFTYMHPVSQYMDENKNGYNVKAQKETQAKRIFLFFWNDIPTKIRDNNNSWNVNRKNIKTHTQTITFSIDTIDLCAARFNCNWVISKWYHCWDPH